LRLAAHCLLNALGGARPHSFLLLVQKKRIKEKDTRRLAPCCRKGFPALLGQNRRCGTRDLRSLRQSSLLPVLTCDARRRQRDRGARIELRSTPSPCAAEHRSRFRRQARACLTERSEGVHARRKRREAQGSRSEAETKPWGAFSSGYSSLGKQRRVTRARSAERLQNKPAR